MISEGSILRSVQKNACGSRSPSGSRTRTHLSAVGGVPARYHRPVLEINSTVVSFEPYQYDGVVLVQHSSAAFSVNRHSTVTHYQRPNMTHLQEGGTGEEVSEILFFSAKSKRRPSLIYSMQIIPVCLSIVARQKGVSATRRGGSNWTPISLLVGHPCKLFHTFR